MFDRPTDRTGLQSGTLNEQHVEVLKRYDEELRQGAPDSTDGAGPSSDTPVAQEGLRDCLQLLERAWPRGGAADAAAAGPDRIGRFLIERPLGQGGFGVVYLATDPELNRQVALKVPRLHALANPDLLERFRREARAAAGLDHPNIVPVFEAGAADGGCYIASAYCPGPNLGQWLKEHSAGVSPAMAARMVAQLADAVAYSHSRSVLHRDIKPGNVLLVQRDDRVGFALQSQSSAGPSPANNGQNPPYTLRLGDFGLAKVIEEAAVDGTLHIAADTAAGATLGTPSYMAPEQAAAGTEAIGPAADIYALGAVLYELLTGRPPFQGPNVVDVLDQVRHAEPVPVRRLRRDVPRDLETICHKCLEKETGRRYPTADELCADLESFQRGEPIRARPPGPVELAWKAMRRHPALTALITLTALALGVFGVQRSLSSAALREVNTSLERTNFQLEEALAAAQRSERAAHEVAYAADISNAWRARQEGDLVHFEDVINRYRDGTPLAEYRGLEWYFLERLSRTEGHELLHLPQGVYSVALTPDRRHWAIAGQDAVVRIVDLSFGNVRAEWDTGQKQVNAVLFSPDGTTLWTSGDDGTVRGWDTGTHRETERFVAHPEGAYELAYYNHPDPDRRRLITCGRERVIRLWNESECRETLLGHTDWVEDIEMHPDGRRLISASQDRSARVWDVATQRSLLTLGDGTGKILHGAVSPDGKVIATCSDKLHLWDADNGTLLLRYDMPDLPYRVCFPSDDGLICVADRAGVLHLFQQQTDDAAQITGLKPGSAWRGHTDRPYALVASHSPDAIVSAGKDGRVVVWNNDGLSLTQPPRYPCGYNNGCAFALRSPQLIVAGISLQSWQYELSGKNDKQLDGAHHR